MTSRMRELEDLSAGHSGHRNCNEYCQRPGNILDGYKQALADLKPVLDAAKAMDDCAFHDVEDPPGAGRCTFCVLRDALAGLEE